MIYGNRIILQYAKDKDVLDIGSCGEQGGKIKPKTLYSQIKKVARSVQGIDIESDDSEIIKGNAETIKLDKKFDIITAGDVIEHMDNPGQFLRNMRQHIKDHGIIIILTPNAKSIGYLPFKGNAYHKMWWCKHTMKHLLNSNGWNIDKMVTGLRRPKNFLYDALRNLLANNLIIIAKPDN